MSKKQEKMTLEKLAVMIKGGFDDADDRISEVKNDLAEVKNDLAEVKNDLKGLKAENSKEHEDLRLRQDNVAYRFELVALSERLERVEKRCPVK